MHMMRITEIIPHDNAPPDISARGHVFVPERSGRFRYSAEATSPAVLPVHSTIVMQKPD